TEELSDDANIIHYPVLNNENRFAEFYGFTGSRKKGNFKCENITAFTEALNRLNINDESTFEYFAETVANLYTDVTMPDNESEFQGSLYAFAKNKVSNTFAERYVHHGIRKKEEAEKGR